MLAYPGFPLLLKILAKAANLGKMDDDAAAWYSAPTVDCLQKPGHSGKALSGRKEEESQI